MAKQTHQNSEAQKQVDQYINSAPEFAQSICKKLREIIHKADPEITEEWKWRAPNFTKDGLLCGFGAFQKHVNFFFFKGALMKDPDKLFTEGEVNKASRGVKFTSVDQIKEKIIIKYVREAIKLNEQGAKIPDREIPIPVDFKSALKKSNLLDQFEKMAYTHRKEYIVWIEDAKKEETRIRRIDKAVEMITQGKNYS